MKIALPTLLLKVPANATRVQATVTSFDGQTGEIQLWAAIPAREIPRPALADLNEAWAMVRAGWLRSTKIGTAILRETRSRRKAQKRRLTKGLFSAFVALTDGRYEIVATKTAIVRRGEHRWPRYDATRERWERLK